MADVELYREVKMSSVNVIVRLIVTMMLLLMAFVLYPQGSTASAQTVIIVNGGGWGPGPGWGPGAGWGPGSPLECGLGSRLECRVGSRLGSSPIICRLGSPMGLGSPLVMSDGAGRDCWGWQC